MRSVHIGESSCILKKVAAAEDARGPEILLSKPMFKKKKPGSMFKMLLGDS